MKCDSGSGVKALHGSLASAVTNRGCVSLGKSYLTSLDPSVLIYKEKAEIDELKPSVLTFYKCD